MNLTGQQIDLMIRERVARLLQSNECADPESALRHAVGMVEVEVMRLKDEREGVVQAAREVRRCIACDTTRVTQRSFQDRIAEAERAKTRKVKELALA